MNEETRTYLEAARERIGFQGLGGYTADDCPKGPHRGPEGPNEDLSQCAWCLMPSHAKRPWGETFGRHLADCSLPIWHESYCQPGGVGHPDAPKIRG